MAAIYLVQLEPPLELIRLKDPLTSITYGGKDLFITKDLFFSGHTSNMLLLALCFDRKTDKIFTFIAAFLVGILVLFQHVHYSIDVVGAVVFTFLLVPLGKKFATE
jgi:membrane-associated phospholipid phosphatase